MQQIQYPQPDQLYNSYGKDLYRITGDEQTDEIMNMMQAPQPGDPGSSTGGGGGTLTIPADAVDSGSTASTTAQASGAVQAGKATFTDTAPGYFLGIVNGVGVFNLGNASKYVTWDGSTLTVVGGVSISSLDIPDTTTANSFHVDNQGNAWWGANVATGFATAPASITKAGAATFSNVTITGGSLNINGGVASIDATGTVVLKSVSVGGNSIQYTMTNNGMFSFGDSSDGAATADGSTAVAGATLAGSTYTLTRDVYYTNLTVSTGVTINPAGYRIFGVGTLTLNGTAHINGNGNNGLGGTAGGGSGAAGNNHGVGGSGGAALPDGYLKGSVAGQNGGDGGDGGTSVGPVVPGFAGTNGGTGSSTANSLGTSGSNGGAGGAGGGSSGGGVGGVAGTLGAGGTAGAFQVPLRINSRLFDLLDVSSTGATAKYDNSAAAGSGGGGGGGAESAGGQTAAGGGGAGGAGSAGRIVFISFRNIVIGASATITAIGGNGGDGASGGFGNGGGNAGGGGGGGGGAGANGGQIILIYNTLTNSNGATPSVAAGTGGALGTKGGSTGAGAGTGSDGTAGVAGTAGTIRTFQISL